MRQIYMYLETQAPLTVRANYSARGANAVSYIAGNTLLGSLAATHRSSFPDKREEFERLFLQGRVLYPNLYPAMPEHLSGDGHDIHLPVYPVPNTAQSCKHWSGFRGSAPSTDAGHGVRDTLIDWALFKLSARATENGEKFKPWHAFLEHKWCGICKGPMDHFEGYYRRSGATREMSSTNMQAARLRMHTKVDPDAKSAQGGGQYTRLVFDEGTRFWGALKLVDDDLLSTFTNFVREVGSSGMVRVGTDRTRGMGKVKIETVEAHADVQAHKAHFLSRLQSFNALLTESLARWQLKRFQQNYFFALTLHAPLILDDDFSRYQGTLDADSLREVLGISWEGLEVVYHNAGVRRMMGWQELWGTPRLNESAIDTGSVFLFQCATAPGQAVLDALFDLEEQGMGKRRAEGFGRICICDPFHEEVAPA